MCQKCGNCRLNWRLSWKPKLLICWSVYPQSWALSPSWEVLWVCSTRKSLEEDPQCLSGGLATGRSFCGDGYLDNFDLAASCFNLALDKDGRIGYIKKGNGEDKGTVYIIEGKEKYKVHSKVTPSVLQQWQRGYSSGSSRPNSIKGFNILRLRFALKKEMLKMN